jgi:hypothetical protein
MKSYFMGWIKKKNSLPNADRVCKVYITITHPHIDMGVNVSAMPPLGRFRRIYARQREENINSLTID